MEFLGIEIPCTNLPTLDPEFIPIHLFNQAYLQGAQSDFIIAISAREDRCCIHRTKIRNTPESLPADCYYITRLVKSLLWLYGGNKVTLSGSMQVYEHVRDTFSHDGLRKHDVEIMAEIYQAPFTVEIMPTPPPAKDSPKFLGRHLNGCRIGFDAGGSSRKVSAVVNGKVAYSEEVLWDPRWESDPEYHFRGVVDSMLAAAKKMPRVDAIGVSSAGIYVNNETRMAAIFRSVPPEMFDDHIKNIYIRAAKAMGDPPLEVCNDGDVAALAGAMTLDGNNVLGVAMGASEAGGFVDPKGNLTGWLNELALMPIDVNPEAPIDEWSGDRGCAGSYLSQVAINRLAEKIGIRLDRYDSPVDKLKAVQMRAERGESKAKMVFETVGCYLGHTLAYYHHLYKFDYVLLLGRCMLGAGGDYIFNKAQKVLAEEYPVVASSIMISMPDENSRSVAQSVAAASIPEC